MQEEKKRFKMYKAGKTWGERKISCVNA
ncbi:KxYKxGKxW signal peptide domain-containing protein [Ligilactobacillus acidipiscis]